MARKVINTTHAANRYDILSQTPKNYSTDNWYLKELQDKIDMDWPFRPNRVDIEYEDNWGQQTYSPLEVVIQSVRSEKSTYIADDCKQLVFKDISERRFVVGSRFRFGDFHGQTSIDDIPVEDRNIWLGINFNSTNMTAALVVERCNGMLGSRWVDPETGIATAHYEPVILPQSLSSTSLLYKNSVVQEDSDVIAVVQTNKYTRQYFVNQRFILGYGAERKQVYRIKAIHDFYSSTTIIDAATNAKSQGLTRLYLEVTEAAPGDDFERRLAAQSVGSPVEVDTVVAQYNIKFISPKPMPTFLGDSAVVFTPQLIDGNGNVVADIPFNLHVELAHLANPELLPRYLTVAESAGSFTITRLRPYLGGDLEMTWTVPAASSPTHEALEYKIHLGMGVYA